MIRETYQAFELLAFLFPRRRFSFIHSQILSEMDGSAVATFQFLLKPNHLVAPVLFLYDCALKSLSHIWFCCKLGLVALRERLFTCYAFPWAWIDPFYLTVPWKTVWFDWKRTLLLRSPIYRVHSSCGHLISWRAKWGQCFVNLLQWEDRRMKPGRNHCHLIQDQSD